MKKITSLLTASSFFLVPLVTFAQGPTIGSDNELDNYMDSILAFIDGTLIPFILAIGFFVFVWGMFWYFIAGGTNDDKKEKGKSLMIYATLGFLMIIIFWGVINILADGTGLGSQSLEDTLLPSVSETQ